MRTLIRETHNGKTIGAHAIVPMLSKSNNAKTQPRRANHRGMIRVRSEIVENDMMKTPAIFIP